jgi:hypothetical protein
MGSLSIPNLLHDIMFYQTSKEGTLAKRAGAYKSEKRRKEVSRQKKREEKLQRKLHKGLDTKPEGEQELTHNEVPQDEKASDSA